MISGILELKGPRQKLIMNEPLNITNQDIATLEDKGFGKVYFILQCRIIFLPIYSAHRGEYAG